MIWRLILSVLVALPATLAADSVVPTRTIRANTIISETDVTLRAMQNAKGFAAITDVVGQEARVVLYPGRVIQVDDVGPPALVSRNQVVRLAFSAGGLQIITEGRALERGAVGDLVRIMNLSSRTTVIGQVLANGTIKVSP
ncbi:MAG: flagellar basal body P-ring formation chaperone FlgA [Pseudomonadota bacterium]